MEATHPLLTIAYRAHHQIRRVPLRSLQAVSKPQYQHRPLAHATYRTSASMSSANESTVMDAIKHDHAELKEYYNNILSAKDNDSQIRWQNQFVWELARHSIGEELVVYPAMEKHMGPEGKEMANKDRTEHNKVSGLPQHVDFGICDLD
jgi:Hemerythrin HHE cation binding domain